MKYAYWRGPDTKLQRDDRNAPTRLFQEIGEHSRVQADGSISWTNFRQEYSLAAYSSIAISEPCGRLLNEHDSASLVRSAVNDLIRQSGGGKPLIASQILAQVERAADAFFRRTAQERLLVTSLSIEQCSVLPVQSLGLRIDPVWRKDYPLPERLTKFTSFVTRHLDSTRYAYVSVLSNCVSLAQALDHSLRSLTYLRGIWNWLETFAEWDYGVSNVPRRVHLGKVYCAPVYTLYKSDRTLADEMYWFDPDYVEDAHVFKPSRGWDFLEEQRNRIVAKIEKLSYREELEELFVRYAAALDQPNLDSAFLMLWGLLEKISDTVGSNYDKTVERISWPYAERAIPRQILNQLRARRNQLVHSAFSSVERDQLCFCAKSFVDEHLLSLVNNVYRVNSLKEYGEFLDSPYDVGRLCHVRDRAQRALDMRMDDVAFRDGDGI